MNAVNSWMEFERLIERIGNKSVGRNLANGIEPAQLRQQRLIAQGPMQNACQAQRNQIVKVQQVLTQRQQAQIIREENPRRELSTREKIMFTRRS